MSQLEKVFSTARWKDLGTYHLIFPHNTMAKAGVRMELLKTVKAKKLAASILWSFMATPYEETRELPGERDNPRNNARCTQARKTTHSMDGQHQDVDRTHHGRVNQNGRGQRLSLIHISEPTRPY